MSKKEIQLDADSPLIQYTGRIDFSNPQQPKYTYSGVSIKIKFKGTGVSAKIVDFAEGGEMQTNYYNVIIDDTVIIELPVNNEDTLYKLVKDLTNKVHTLELFKRTETQVGMSSFKGFIIKGSEVISLPEKPIRKMEWIGDSWSVGYGNLAPATPPIDTYHSKNEDNYWAWGAIIARQLQAQYHCIAMSGRGVSRNNTGTTENLMPLEFQRTLGGDSTSKWDYNNYIPDMVVIRLGANDIFPESWDKPLMLDSTLFVKAYIGLIQDVRKAYPNAKILCVFAGSITDEWPVGMMWLTRFRHYFTAISTHFTSAGDKAVYLHELKPLEGEWGENYHPSVKMHKTIADEMVPVIKQIMNWK